MELKEIIESLKITCEETTISPSDECILENAVKIFLSEKIQGFKEKNMQSINESKKSIQTTPKQESNTFQEATVKQKNFLKKLGYKEDLNITKLKAKDIIKNLLEKQK